MKTASGSRNGGFTLIEALLALALASLVIGALVSLFRGASRMNDASSLSAAQLSGLAAQEAIALDLHQMAVDRTASQAIVVAANGISFHRVVFRGNETLLQPVRYKLERTRAGNFRLCRTEITAKGTRTTRLEAVFAALEFSIPGSGPTGEHFLHVSMQVLADDLPPGPARRAVQLDLVLRIPIPPEMASNALAPSTELSRVAELMPLE
jgi:type II secretory pathway pseudopilin PulG